MKTQDITYQLWEDVEAKKDNLTTKVYNWMQKDLLYSVQLDGNVFWFEFMMTASVPNYVHDFLVKWGKSKGYKYLYQ